MDKNRHRKGERKILRVLKEKFQVMRQLELRFSQRSNDHTPDINNTDLYPGPKVKLPAEGVKPTVIDLQRYKKAWEQSDGI